MKQAQGSWTVLPPLPSARSHTPVIPFQGKLYAFGGGGPAFQSMSSCAVYDPAAGGWQTLADMPTKRSGTAAFLVGEQMYVVGGGYKKPDGNFQFLTTVEIYTPKTDHWQTGPSLLQPHDYPAATMLDGKLYILGGHHPDACLGGPRTDPGFSFCERFTPGGDTWEQIADMPTPRFAAAAVSENGKILAAGGVAFTPEGFNNFDFAETYDPASNLWKQGGQFSLPWPAAGHGLTIADGHAFFFGGYSTDNIHNRAAVYDKKSKQWEMLPPMPLPRAAMGVAVMDNTIYLVGGWADDGRTPIDSVVAYSW